MKVLILGYFGAGNFGDDIMLESFISHTKKLKPNIKFDLLKMYRGEIKIKNINDIGIIDYYMVMDNKLKKAVEFMNIMKEYDWILWVGGTCFTDCDGDGMYNYAIIAKKILNKKVGYLGVGIGKLTKKSRVKKTKKLIKICDLITVRDEYSYEYAMNVLGENDRNKLYLTEDLAYSYFDKRKCIEMINNETNSEMYENIVVSWRNLEGYIKDNQKEYELIDSLVEFIIEIKNNNKIKNIIILPLDDKEDIEKNQYIFNAIEKKIASDEIRIILNSTPEQKVDILKSCDLNISGRLHGIFVTEMLNIKTIALSYAIKIDQYLTSIDKLDDCINVYNISKNHLEDKFYMNDYNKLNPDTIKHKIAISKVNFKILSSYLD